MTQHDQELQDTLRDLQHLAPTPQDAPKPAAEALAHLHQRLHQQQNPSWLTQLNTKLRSIIMSTQTKRFAWAGLALALLIALFSFPGPQALASEFLGLFRVQKFAPISISPEQIERLRDLDLDGLYPGELTMTTEPEPAQKVDSLEEAALLYGRDVATIDTLAAPDHITYQTGGAGTLVVNLDNARQMAEIAGTDPALLPDALDGAAIDVTTYGMVAQSWHLDGTTLIQMPSPAINYPANVNPAPIGQALLEVLGMPTAEAENLANSIDWSNTLLLPIPQELGSFGEVNINGHSGLLIESFDGTGASVTWQAGETLYFLSSYEMAANGLIQLAESIQ